MMSTNSNKATITTPSDTEIVITRTFDAPRALVFEEMPELMGVITATFDEHDGRTTLTNVCQYPSKETRDAIIDSGMETGLQETYDQLDEVLATL